MTGAAAGGAHAPAEEHGGRLGGWPVLCLAVLVLGAAVVHWQEGARTSFFYDEWSFIAERHDGGLGSLFTAHNGHPSVLPVAWYRLLFATVGLETYTPYRAAVLVLHLAAGALLFAHARRRCAPPIALVLAALLLYMGSAWQNTLWAFQVGFLGSVVTGLGALLLLERGERATDLLASGLLVASVLSSGVGIPFTAAAATELALQRRRWVRLPLVLAGPGVAYAVWYARYGESQADLDRLGAAGSFIATGISAAFGGLLGAAPEWGRTFAGAAVALALAAAVTGRVRTPRLAAAGMGLLAFYGLTAVGRGANPDASRYLYIGGVFVLLGLAELLRGVRVPPLGTMVVVLVAVVAVRANLSNLDAGARGLESEAIGGRTELAAVELARDQVEFGYRPDPRRMPSLAAGPYLDAVDDLGSPAYDLGTAARAPDVYRAEADRVLFEALRVRVTVEPAPAGDRPSCRRVEPWVPTEVALDGAALVTGDATTEVRLRRLSARAAIAPVAVTPPTASLVWIRIPRDASPRPWSIEASAPVLLCDVTVTG
jgi:hypothetical protein